MDQADYDGLLQNLPRDWKNQDRSPYSRVHIGLMVVGLVMFVLFGLLAFYEYCKWNFLGDSSRLFFIAYLCSCSPFWIIFIFIMKIQGNNAKYQDDVELLPDRKIRPCTERIIRNIVILIALCLLANVMMTSVSKYILESKVASDKLRLWDIREAVSITTHYLTEEEKDTLSSYRELLEGVDIVEWGKPSDHIQQEIASQLGIRDFGELRGRFELSEEAGVYVIVSDTDPSVTLLHTSDGVKYSSHVENGTITVR